MSCTTRVLSGVWAGWGGKRPMRRRHSEGMKLKNMIVLLALAGLIAPPNFASGRDAGLVSSIRQFESGGKQVLVDVLGPAAPERGKKLPVVILVHGFDGLKTPKIDYRKHAKELALHGYVVMLPHYFEATHTNLFDPTKFAVEMTNNAPVWLKIVEETVAFAAKQPEIDDKRIGILGFSLGSYLAVYVTATDTRVAALVEYFGGAFPGVDQLLNKRPPMLILHGDKDKIVNVDEAKKLATICTDRDIDNEMKIYKGAGHGFYGPDDEDARRRAIQWFDSKMATTEVKKN